MRQAETFACRETRHFNTLSHTPWVMVPPRPYATRAFKPGLQDVFDFEAALRGGLAIDREEARSPL
jgi:hypothetical protein